MQTERILLTRYEIARVIGLRALQIDEGATPLVAVTDNDHSLSIATRELSERKLDAVVCRDGNYYPTMTARFPRDLTTTLSLLQGDK